MDDDTLQGYLQNHWLAATSGVATFRRVGRSHHDPEVAAEIRRLGEEVAEDREALRGLMEAVGARPSLLGTPLARVAAELGRLKPNGRLVTRPPLTDVLEVEALRLAVAGKANGWQLLREIATHDPRLDQALLDRLQDRAAAQLRALEALHLRVARQRLLSSN